MAPNTIIKKHINLDLSTFGMRLELYTPVLRVTLFGVNMGNETFEFGLGSPLNGSRIESYYFSTRDGNLTDREILLNGKVLQVSISSTFYIQVAFTCADPKSAKKLTT